MRATLWLSATLLIGATPWLILAALAAAGYLSAPLALAAMALIAAAAAALGWWWASEIAAMQQAVRHLATEDTEGFHRHAERIRLPSLGLVLRSLLRIVRGFEARLGRAERRLQTLEAIIELLPNPLLLLKPDGTVARANAAARAAFGADLPALLRHPDFRRAVDRAASREGPQHVELSLVVPALRELEVTAIPLERDGAAPPSEVLVVLADRTREHAVERMRADFVANASHELRTPLASLIGFIDTLRGPAADDPQAQQRFLSIMAEQAERMNRLIDDLLQLSRVELLEHQLPTERVDVGQLVAGVAASFEPRFASRHMRLEISIDPATPEVPADAEQVIQVVQNLLDNAVKYGKEGGCVRLALAPAGAVPGPWPSKEGLVLTVADDGPGIPRQHLPRLTERFYRVDKGRSRLAGGTGLGLAIVKHVVNRHRGQLVIESQEGVGSTFRVWLPQGAAPEAA
jgi:two-component system phosphate regulon sensor histidine kinase PhoR